MEPLNESAMDQSSLLSVVMPGAAQVTPAGDSGAPKIDDAPKGGDTLKEPLWIVVDAAKGDDAPKGDDASSDSSPVDLQDIASSATAGAASALRSPVVNAAKVLARVLVRCEHGMVDEVVELTAKVARAAEKLGHVSAHPDSVAYAMKVNRDAGS